MGAKADIPELDVAVALIQRGESFLAVYNPKWGQFTLPMTKRRQWRDPNMAKDAPLNHEQWIDAAARAAAEWLERTCFPVTEPVVESPGYQQSDRDGIWKRYHFKVFRVELAEDEDVPEGKVVEWLTPADFKDEDRRPVSPTARHLITLLTPGGHRP